MQIRSESFEYGKPIPSAFAAGTPEGFGPNRNPHLAWSETPEGTRSFALLCIDPDVPTVGEMVNKEGVEIPADQPRTEFFHWAAVDIPADFTEIAEGAASEGVTKGGKRTPEGLGGARQGLNDYTKWFDGDPDLGGDWLGYDGPYPPANDLRLHRYFFRVFALDVETLDIPDRFAGPDVLAAIQGHVLAEASYYGSYTLNPTLSGAAS